MSDHRVHFGDNLEALRAHVPDGAVDLIYIDPPFNTGSAQVRRSLRVKRDESGDRVGFGGQRYASQVTGTTRYEYVHLDPREVHYVKVMLDGIFGRECFLNEIIWAYDYGGRPKNRWPAKHDNILLYVRDPKNYVFDQDAVDRIPYMAPGLVGPEKAARGKLPTDTWWHTIVPTNSREKTGYPTQKPLGILERIVRASSRPKDLVLDYFAGSGTTGEAALRNGRRFLLVDDNLDAIRVMARRFAGRDVEYFGYDVEASGNRDASVEA
jgi:site-specific DNA-methyltransferase (adenine-specific)